ncbi:Na+/H+ antiporter NhaA [Marivivens niveibacter]|nr:Na+/H+ antiporter NhaA [Marivivens niveibacter]
MSLARALDRFFSHDAAGGIVLMVSAVLAMIIANSGLTDAYHGFLNTYFTVQFGGEGLQKPLILWINDGLMAVFFFLIGLELKREMLEGKLKNPRDVFLPGMAAVGGMVVPALIFVAFNWGNTETIHGWAIPAATDIAFAIGVLALVGSKAPSGIKIFLLTLAILDDMGAIVIIALFYTADLKIDYLWLSLIPLTGLWLRNYYGLHRIAPSILLGVILWFFVLKSGVHATLAGVITAFFIPLKDKYGKSPLHSIEHGLSPYVFFLIVPIFAFSNAGVVLAGITWDQVFAPLPIGIALGLYLGKKIGVFGTTWLLVKSGLAQLPYGVTWRHIYGVSCLAGIGFTMSLFIGGLSFGEGTLMNEVRIGVLGGSIISAITGYLVLQSAPAKEEPKAKEA